MTAPWWRDAVGYEVYLRSFADSDGDGVGDLGGVIAHLDHLQWLGVDALWITPWYPSPQRDHGYDVADYRAIDPRFGTLADVDRLIAEAHGRGLRVIADMVPNHTAAEHAWFQAALADPTGPYRDYYIWRDGLPGADGEPGARPPNNWLSHFGGPAWTRDPASGQWWLHLFLPEQPDLNWANPKVREEFDAILEFWVDRGVDGFRLDVAHGLAKHPELLDNPPKAPDALRAHRDEHAGAFDAMDHVHDLDQDAVVEVHRGWRRVTAPRGALLLGEAYLLDAPRLRRYVDPHEGLDLVFWFPPLHVAWDAATVRQVLEAGTVLGREAVAWITGSHDRPRAATRLGQQAARARAVDARALPSGGRVPLPGRGAGPGGRAAPGRRPPGPGRRAQPGPRRARRLPHSVAVGARAGLGLHHGGGAMAAVRGPHTRRHRRRPARGPDVHAAPLPLAARAAPVAARRAAGRRGVARSRAGRGRLPSRPDRGGRERRRAAGQAGVGLAGPRHGRRLPGPLGTLGVRRGPVGRWK